MSTILSLAAILALIIVWISRYRRFKENLYLYMDRKASELQKNEAMHQMFDVVKLAGFDFIVTVLTLVITGGARSVFGLQIIIWVNALTTFFAPLIFRSSSAVSYMEKRRVGR